MKSVGYILWGLTMVSLALAAFKSSMIWVGAPLLGVALSYSLLRVFLYRPPEVHLGVVYRLGRFSRWVGSEDWEMIIPWVDEIKRPISLHLRRVEVGLSDLLTHDQVPVDCECFVYYRLDLRRVRADFRTQALHIPDEGWNSIIRTVLREAAGEAVGGVAFQHLLTAGGRQHLKHALSTLLATRMRGLGLIVNPETGVSVRELRPADVIWQAMLDRLAAVSLGEAALARVRPVLQELSQGPELAWDVLLLEWAAAAAKDGNVPRVVMPPGIRPAHDGAARGVLPAALQPALQSGDEQQHTGQQNTHTPRQNGFGEREAGIARVVADASLEPRPAQSNSDIHQEV